MFCAKLEVMKKVLITLSCFVFLTLLFPRPIFADCRSTGCPPGQTCDPGIWICTGTITPGYVNTALGYIPTDPAELVKWILGWSIAIGGGLAVLLSLWGGGTIILAGGNPEKINEGKEIITSAISGILFILFSVFLLRFIGVDILGILKL